MFRKKFGFEKYESLDIPTLFFGLYRKSDIAAVQEHKGSKIIWLAGTDAMKPKTLHVISKRKEFENAIIVAESPWIAKDLDAYGIKYEPISLFLDDVYNWSPEPLGKSLYWYSARNSKYGKKYLGDVQKAFPDLNIIMNDNGTVPQNEMAEIYKECFAGIRPIEHDGMSQTVGELGLMGRMSIWNGNVPFSVPYEGVEGIIQAIKRLRRGYNYKVVARHARNFFIENEIKWTNLILRLCGTDELDIINMFYESIKAKCGSIFRIQRKSDIEKIGGLGDKQFERPWFAEQMIKLGKKQLLVSKNSGFIASEWKSIEGDKGYKSGINYLTYDKRFC
jgi:hypothetical protein